MMAATMMLATSCENELDLGANAGENAQVTFSVGTPKIATRAYSDGQTATVLQYAVYDAAGNELTDLTVTDAKIHGSTTVNLQLTTGNTYSVIFWVAAEGAPYDVDFGAKTMTVKYDNAVSNDETRDAFYKYHTFTVKGAQTETIELKRPFAQLNIGTADYAASESAGYVPTTSAVTVKNIYTTLNLVNGAVTGETEAIFVANAIPEGEQFPVVGYEYLAMNYLLVNSEKEVVDVEFTYADDGNDTKTRTVGSVPVQRNHRTNIYGQLLTSDVDINVEIEPEYDDDHLEAWDGTTLNEPTFDAATNTYKISHAAELAYIAALVNGTLDTDNVTRAAGAADDLAGKTISLECDINLNGKEWTPIGVGTNRFNGTLEGNNHTIHGLKVTQRHGEYAQAALFGNIAGTATFRNVTIKDAEVRCPDYVENTNFYGSALIGTMYGTVTIENVDVVDSYISGYNKVGALIAHDGMATVFNIKNCDVSETTFETNGTADAGLVGGLIGYVNYESGEHHISNSTVKNCTFNVVNSTNTGKRANGQLIGGINSTANQKLYIDNCSVVNNTWNEKFYSESNEITDKPFISPYGELIGGERDDAPEGKVFIDGVEVEILSPVDDAYGVGTDSKGNYVVTADEGLSYIVSNKLSDASAKVSVVLATDINLKTTIETKTELTFDLNGHDLCRTVENDGTTSALFNNKGVLRIVNSGAEESVISFVASNPDMADIPGYATNTITNEADLYIGTGVTVTNESQGGASYAVDNKGKFTLDGGTLLGKVCALRVAKFNQDDVQFTMEKGTVKAGTPAWIHLPGSDASVAPKITVTINGGVMQSTKTNPDEADVMYTYSYGNSHSNTSITINGGEFLGGTVSIGLGYYGDVPVLTINGGTFDHNVLQWNQNETSKILYHANK